MCDTNWTVWVNSLKQESHENKSNIYLCFLDERA